jgi:hypothetical protein
MPTRIGAPHRFPCLIASPIVGKAEMAARARIKARDAGEQRALMISPSASAARAMLADGVKGRTVLHVRSLRSI